MIDASCVDILSFGRLSAVSDTWVEWMTINVFYTPRLRIFHSVIVDLHLQKKTRFQRIAHDTLQVRVYYV